MKTPLLVGVVLMVHVVALSCVFLMPGCRTAVVSDPLPADQAVKMPQSIIVEEPVVAVTPVAPVKAEPKETLRAETTEYVIGKNECLSRIASQYKLSVSEILALNNMKDANKIRVGQKILLPGNVDVSKRPKALKAKETVVAPAPTSEAASADTAATSEAPAAGSTYLVKKGDSLGEIAKEHKVKTSALKKANNLTSDNIRIGQKLVIPGAADTAAPAKTAPSADAVPSVPAGTVPPVDDSAPVTPAPVTPAPAAVGGAAAPAPAVPAAPAVTPVLKKHKVMPGEDIYGIGIMYNVSIQKLKELNNLATDKPAPGTELLIPDNV